MELPQYVLRCIDALEEAHFSAYAVGGCVRDALLGLTPHDYDLCTNATPEQIRNVFSQYRLVLAGEKHGTVTVITDGGPVEITTYRSEGNYTDSRHPGWVRFVANVADDLSRRDFTVNAMAFSPYRGFADPFGGREDLRQRCLRAVGDPVQRFTEDSLRILRGVRFSVKYHLTPDEQTLDAMFRLAPSMDQLARERVFAELSGLLPLVSANDLHTFQPILTQIIPELAPAVGFDQKNAHHTLDLYSHTAQVVASVPGVLHLRLAALLHDVGKPATFSLDDSGCGHFYGHAQVSAEMANSILLRMKTSTALRRQVVDLIQWHMTPLEPDKRLLRRRLGKLGFSAVWDLLALQQADLGGNASPEELHRFRQIADLLKEIKSEDSCLSLKDLAVNGTDLIALGFAPGPGIKKCLAHLLSAVQEEQLENKKDALLDSARAYLEEMI